MAAHAHWRYAVSDVLTVGVAARRRARLAGAADMKPRPNTAWYNDWRSVAVAPRETFTPVLPVSVVIPYYEAPEELARTLAALEGQTYPRELFEVVIVDDGSRTPLAPPADTPLDVKVIHQEHRGFGAGRARNNGVRTAAHDIIVFLDCDMLPEAGCLAAHARWHHAVSDAVTLGFREHVSVAGVDAEAIRKRAGTLQDLFAGRPTDPLWLESNMARTDDLTAKGADDLFQVLVSANFGIRKDFFWLAGGFDESFNQWGGEDTELGYRVYTRGGLLVPVREAFSWHQGRWSEDRERKKRSLELQRAKLAQLIAHHSFRRASPGRSFTVPQYVVTMAVDGLPAKQVLETVERTLAGRVHDLVVNVRMPEGSDEFLWLQRQLGPDPRVRIGAARDALDEFPAASFHVTLSSGGEFPATWCIACAPGWGPRRRRRCFLTTAPQRPSAGRGRCTGRAARA